MCTDDATASRAPASTMTLEAFRAEYEALNAEPPTTLDGRVDRLTRQLDLLAAFLAGDSR